jgi:hypothetical protein
MYLAIDFLPCELAYDACTFILIQLATSAVSLKDGSIALFKVTLRKKLINRGYCQNLKKLSSQAGANSHLISSISYS